MDSTLAPPPPIAETLDEVTVTAQRRAQNLQDVPVAVTALTSEELERRQVYDIQALQYAVPSMVASPTVGNSTTATISLRGWGELDVVPTVDPAVGLYLDGVYISRSTGANLELVDMQRVEVLRGPQGTLFGRDAIAGAINLVPNRPAPQYSASLQGVLGNYDRRELTAVLNLPLGSSGAAVRVAGKHTEHDGYGEAVLLGRPLSDDDTDYLRAQLQLNLATHWSLLVGGDLTRTLTGSQRIGFLATDPPSPSLAIYHDMAPRYVQDNRAGNFNANIWGSSATLRGELGQFSFESITAYRWLHVDLADTDSDGTPYDLRAIAQRVQYEHQFSQEFQVRGRIDGARLDWVTGLVYFTESAEFQNGVVGPTSPNVFLIDGTASNSSAAAYAQLDFALSQELRLTGGVRYNADWRQLVSRNAIESPSATQCWLTGSIIDPGQTCQATLPRQRYSFAPFTLGVDYTPRTNTLLYAKVSQGYRAGGYNARGGTPTEFLTFGPESVTSYEAGAKADLLSERLRSNVALYRADYDDVQLTQFVPDPLQGAAVIRQNAGQARIQGIELELIGLVGRLQLAGSMGLTDGRYFHLNPDVVGVTLDSGLALPRTTYALSADLPLHFAAGAVQLHADYAWRSDGNDGAFNATCQCHNAYGLLNARVTFQFRAAPITVGLWSRNLSNTRYMAQSFDFNYLAISIPGDPRAYGVSLSYNFGAQAAAP